MMRLPTLTTAAVLTLGASTAMPAVATASSGGTAYQKRAAVASPATLHVRHQALLGSPLRLTGKLAGSGAGHRVSIQRLDPHAGGWTEVASARTTRGGVFSARWHTNHIGRFPLRAIGSGASAAAAATPSAQVTVYLPAIATWYGPGFYGSQTACGQTLTTHTLGVAHRTLRCGTRVALLYHGHHVTVPVIDRGPYANGADWDLTGATARALHFGSTARIGAVALRRR